MCPCLLVPLLLLGCAGTPPPARITNLVANPGFESVGPGKLPVGWNTYQRLDGSTFRIVSEPGFAQSGTTCVAIEQRDAVRGNYAVLTQEVPAAALSVYRYSFWVKTDNVHPLTPYNEDRPSSCGTIIPLDAKRKELPSEPPYPQSANVFMTHDWQRFEISFRTPAHTAYVRISLALGNAAGTVYFDSVSLVSSAFKRIDSPPWLSEAIAYCAGPWEFAQFGGGKGFVGLTREMPALEALGANLLYLLPLWEDAGWYNIADHFALFHAYGTELELKAMVDEAHRRGMKVILDLAGTVGVPMESRLVREHPAWLISGGDNALYRSWADLCGLDTNRPDVQEYFAAFAAYYVERFDVDGYRCDMAMVSPPAMYEKVRRAIRQVKPDAVLIAEDTAPVGHETAYDGSHDFSFLSRMTALLENPEQAGATIRWLEAQRDFYPPGALHLRYLEGVDIPSTIAARCGFSGSRAFAALLFTIDGIPMIYNGQEAGNTEPAIGWWKPPIDWKGGPDAPRYRQMYSTLTHVRRKYPALRGGSIEAIDCPDDRVAAYARVLPGAQTVVAVINFSNAPLTIHLDLSARALQVPGGSTLVDVLDDSRFTASGRGSLTLGLQPLQPRILLAVTGP